MEKHSNHLPQVIELPQALAESNVISILSGQVNGGLEHGGPYKGALSQHNGLSISALGTDKVHVIFHSKETAKVGINETIHLDCRAWLEDQAFIRCTLEISTYSDPYFLM
jgi:hypothetical protein